MEELNLPEQDKPNITITQTATAGDNRFKHTRQDQAVSPDTHSTKLKENQSHYECHEFRVDGVSETFYVIPTTAEPEEDREEMAELSAAPMAKRPCQCCCQTYSEILSFLEKRSEAEQRLREEELALRREELEIQRSKICGEHYSVISTRKGGENILPCYIVGAIFG